MSQPKKYLSQWKIEELKTALEDLGLDTTGKRPDFSGQPNRSKIR